MNYSKQYSNLINRALSRPLVNNTHYEKHHILPKSLGGQDIIENITFLTPKEHYIAHMLLWRMGNPNQIFAVKCFLDDSINIRSPRFGLFRWKKWLRRMVAYRSATVMRDNARATLFNNYNERINIINKSYQQTINEIENHYIEHITTVFLDQAFDNFEVNKAKL